MGRFEHIKGTHLAIDIVRRAGRRLIIAGSVPEAHRDFFEREVAPNLDDDHVHYIGPVDDMQKSQLLCSAATFLMPILWKESFGIVMAETLAWQGYTELASRCDAGGCGTWRDRLRVRHGRSRGGVCEGSARYRPSGLPRSRPAPFLDEDIDDGYLAVYHQLVSH